MNPLRKLLRTARNGSSKGAMEASNDPAGPVVALIGHCGPDTFSLERFVSKATPGARIISVRSAKALTAALEEADALLVNRALDGRFDTRSGVELIQRIRAASPASAPAAILISNHAEAQQQAADAGALPGFGKSDLRTSAAAERLRAAISAKQ